MTSFVMGERTSVGRRRERELAIEALRLWPWVVAGGRVMLGLVAMTKPELPTRPWIGGALAGDRRVHVLARALGGRDVALGAGALWALRRASSRQETVAPGSVETAIAWTAAGALADAVDVAATLASWRSLPHVGRLAVMAAAGGAVAVTAVGLGSGSFGAHGNR